MLEKGKNLVYLYVKLSILSIGGARLIFINTTKCPTKLLIQKSDVVLSSHFVCSYCTLQYKRENLVCLFLFMCLDARIWKIGTIKGYEDMILPAGKNNWTKIYQIGKEAKKRGS